MKKYEKNYQKNLLLTLITCLTLSTILSLIFFIISISISVKDNVSVDATIIMWIFTLYYSYGTAWLIAVVRFSMWESKKQASDIALAFSGLPSILNLFNLIVWICLIKEAYYQKKYNVIPLVKPEYDEKKAEETVKSSKKTSKKDEKKPNEATK